MRCFVHTRRPGLCASGACSYAGRAFVREGADLLCPALQVLIDPVCLMTCSPELLRSFVYKVRCQRCFCSTIEICRCASHGILSSIKGLMHQQCCKACHVGQSS